jgi:hypothetical protein
METNQHTPEETQEDINARLALISKAVAEKLNNNQQGVNTKSDQNALPVAACPIDPMERLQCESCQ